MTFRVDATDEADRNASEILDWLLTEQAGEAGVRWFLGLEASINSLAENPHRCSLAPENRAFPFEVRQLLYGRKPHVYRILFAIRDDTVYILHIRHGRRLPLPHLKKS